MRRESTNLRSLSNPSYIGANEAVISRMWRFAARAGRWMGERRWLFLPKRNNAGRASSVLMCQQRHKRGPLKSTQDFVLVSVVAVRTSVTQWWGGTRWCRGRLSARRLCVQIFVCGVCMFFYVCLRVFSLGSPVSPHNTKRACEIELRTLNCVSWVSVVVCLSMWTCDKLATCPLCLHPKAVGMNSSNRKLVDGWMLGWRLLTPRKWKFACSPTSVWLLLEFLPQSKDVHVRRIGNSKLCVLGVGGCLSFFGPATN